MAGWRFDQGPKVAAITTVGVLEGRLPVLVVQHAAEDHGWAFLCGTTDETGDGRVIGMGEMLSMDPTLGAIADLPPGWMAWRGAVGEAWSRVPDDSARSGAQAGGAR